MGPLPGSERNSVVAARGPDAQLLAHGGVLAARPALVGDYLTLTLPVRALCP